MKSVIGYPGSLTARPSELVDFHLSSFGEGPTELQVVRLIGCDDSGSTPNFEEIEIDAPCNGVYDIEAQRTDIGSRAVVPGFGSALNGASQFELSLWVLPTALELGAQTLLSCGAQFQIQFQPERTLVARVGTACVSLENLPEEALWMRLVLMLDGGTLSLSCEPVARTPGARVACQPLAASATFAPRCLEIVDDADLLFGADAVPFERNGFFGRIESPKLIVDGDCAGHWDFSQAISSLEIMDTGPQGRHGYLENMPTRAVPGRLWDGSVNDWRSDPTHYGAIHFHADDLADAKWPVTCRWMVPVKARSGVYAMRMRQQGSDHYVPVFIAPALGEAGSDVAYLASTATYAAYANMASLLDLKPLFSAMRFDDQGDALLVAHREFGLSHYDHHLDGHGVVHSSLRRPIVNMTAKGPSWSMTADGAITAWLERAVGRYDVLSDELLHAEGEAILKHYRVIVTGTHPEYWSTAMMSALKRYLDAGGRLMYLGGNGFYWRVSFHPDMPYVVECRRAEDGTRAWIAEPGSYHHQGNGELGGLWRRLGQPPQALVGVGFAAQGFTGSAAYLRQPDADNPRAAFITKGVSSFRFGDFGAQGGGAAGEEVDRADRLLGTPAHALTIASSEPVPGLLRAKEELHQTVPTDMPDPDIRADMVFFETANGGAVWSTGSIAWSGALAHNDYDNDVQTITANVLRRFRDAEPLEHSD